MPCNSATLLRFKSFVTILRVHLLGQHDQFGIHFFDVWKIFVDDPDVHVTHFLDLVQDIKAASSPRAL